MKERSRGYKLCKPRIHEYDLVDTKNWIPYTVPKILIRRKRITLPYRNFGIKKHILLLYRIIGISKISYRIVGIPKLYIKKHMSSQIFFNYHIDIDTENFDTVSFLIYRKIRYLWYFFSTVNAGFQYLFLALYTNFNLRR